MSAPRRIGILGGMGPEATILLQQRLVAAMAGGDDSDHIPLIIDMNTQVPSRIAHLIEKTGIDPGPALAEMAKRLEVAGAEALAIPCNTAHYYADHITVATKLPLLNMVEMSAQGVVDDVADGGPVGILASPAVQMTGLFDKALAHCGLKALWPKDGEAMLSAIRMIKAHGPCARSREILHLASDELLSCGAKTQLVACSEFSLISDSANPRAKVIDTLNVLVAAILDFSLRPFVMEKRK